MTKGYSRAVATALGVVLLAVSVAGSRLLVVDLPGSNINQVTGLLSHTCKFQGMDGGKLVVVPNPEGPGHAEVQQITVLISSKDFPACTMKFATANGGEVDLKLTYKSRDWFWECNSSRILVVGKSGARGTHTYYSGQLDTSDKNRSVLTLSFNRLIGGAGETFSGSANPQDSLEDSPAVTRDVSTAAAASSDLCGLPPADASAQWIQAPKEHSAGMDPKVFTRPRLCGGVKGGEVPWNGGPVHFESDYAVGIVELLTITEAKAKKNYIPNQGADDTERREYFGDRSRKWALKLQFRVKNPLRDVVHKEERTIDSVKNAVFYGVDVAEGGLNLAWGVGTVAKLAIPIFTKKDPFLVTPNLSKTMEGRWFTRLDVAPQVGGAVDAPAGTCPYDQPPLRFLPGEESVNSFKVDAVATLKTQDRWENIYTPEKIYTFEVFDANVDLATLSGMGVNIGNSLVPDENKMVSIKFNAFVKQTNEAGEVEEGSLFCIEYPLQK